MKTEPPFRVTSITIATLYYALYCVTTLHKEKVCSNPCMGTNTLDTIVLLPAYI